MLRVVLPLALRGMVRRMIEATSKTARRDFPQLMDAIERGEHVRITRRSHQTGVLVPEEWHDAADRALAIIDGLAALGTGGTDVRCFLEFVVHPAAVNPEEIDLFRSRPGRPRMATTLEAAAAAARTDFAGPMDAIERGEHVRITRRSHRTAVLVPEEWHDAADRALAIVRGLVQLVGATADVRTSFDAVLRGIAYHEAQLDLFDDDPKGGMAKAS
jgi:antitoxin (DNA-binding transcriptional repressor) of toxin-antitoxin stability system